MSYKISATAAMVKAIDLAAFKPDPSATTWSRLDPMPTSDDVSLGLQAPIADPLWMLARQWQFNEFQGEDAGSPIGADLRLLGVPMARLVHPHGAVPDVALAGGPPVEAMVESEQVLAVHAKLNAQAGLHLIRMLRAAGLAAAIDSLLGGYHAELPDPSDPVADNNGFVWHRLLDGKCIDARRLGIDLRAQADDAAIDAFLTGIGVAGPQPVRDVLKRWRVWLDDLVLESATQGASAYWNPQRLEYSFGLRSDGVQPELRLQADEYTDGKLDWHTYSVTSAVTPGQPVVGAAAIDWSPKRAPMPALARYPGMPADRYWEFEDGQVNFGRMGAAKSDLARLAVMEYALVFGNDWYVLPVTLDVNALYKVDRFTVRDNFGITVPIPPARNLDGSQWTMFEMTVTPSANAPRARLNDCLYLCPSVETLESPPLEHVLMMRDEMANMVWGIEKRVQGASGDPIDRRYESQRLSTNQVLRAPAGAVAVPQGAPLHYKLQTPVAANWIPFLPVKREGATPLNWSIQLQRGVVTQFYQVTPDRLVDARNADYAAFIERLRHLPFVEAKPEGGPAENRLQGFMFHPRGEILRLKPHDPVALLTTDFLRLEEEEVPRDGIEIKRAFNYARDASGRAWLWIGRSKTTGRGEGNSGLRFDTVE
ncbi:MAG: hypothetical protein ABIR94_19475 [Rubrivivax sp.]